MGSPQTTYSLTRSDRLAGGKVYENIHGFVLPRACESASIDFGLGVGEGTTDDQVVVGVGSGPLGIAMRSTANGMDGDDDGQFVQYEDMPIIDKDFVYVTTASTSGAYGDEVVMDNTTGAITIAAAVSGSTTAIGWLAQTVTAAGVVAIFVDSRAGYDVSMSALPAHESTHVDGGSDEIDSALAAGAIPAHASTHEDGGADEIDVTDLSGVLADEQDAGLIKGVTVDDAALADNYILKYNQANTALEYEADATA